MRLRLTMLGLSMAAASLLVPPATSQAQQQRRIDQDLLAAGFVMRLADTPQKLERLRSLPSHKFVARAKDGRRYYIYADPTDCKCAFVGYDQAYNSYRDMVAPPAPPPGVRDFATAPRPTLLMPELVDEMNQDAGLYGSGDILHPGF